MEEENKLIGTHIVIDYFTTSFKLPILDNENKREIIINTVNNIATFLNVSKYEIQKLDYSGRYEEAYLLSTDFKLSILGPKSDGIKTCCLELKGSGCREFERRNPDKHLYDLIKFMTIDYDAKTSRIDIAIDDYSGDVITFDYVKNKLDKKQFTSSFKKKYYKIIGSIEEGYSINFGGRKNTTKALCIYEKHKERKSKNQEINQEYWTRYEMRFYHENAYTVSLDIIRAFEGKFPEIKLKNILGFNQYVFNVMLGILDLKEENNYDINHQSEVNTDKKWLEFLSNPTKIKISLPKPKESNWNKYKDYQMRTLPTYLLVTLLLNKNDYYNFTTDVLKDLYYELLNLKDYKLNKINVMLLEHNLEALDEEKLNELVLNLKDELETERRIPF